MRSTKETILIICSSQHLSFVVCTQKDRTMFIGNEKPVKMKQERWCLSNKIELGLESENVDCVQWGAERKGDHRLFGVIMDYWNKTLKLTPEIRWCIDFLTTYINFIWPVMRWFTTDVCIASLFSEALTHIIEIILTLIKEVWAILLSTTDKVLSHVYIISWFKIYM